MAYQFQTLSSKDISRGIDARSGQNNLQPGFSEDLVNVVTNSGGQLCKRPGFEGYYGYVPIRIEQVQHSGTTIKFTVDSSIDISNFVSTPIVVYGRISDAASAEVGPAAGDFTTTAGAVYYASFTSSFIHSITGGVTYEVEEADHGVSTDNVLMELHISTDGGTTESNTWVGGDLQISSSSTYDVDVDVATSDSYYLLISDCDTSAGDTYVHNVTLSSDPQTVTIPQSTHQLSNANIHMHCYYMSGTEWVRMYTDAWTVNVATNEVAVTFTGMSGSQVQLCLANGEPGDTDTITVAAGASETVTVTHDSSSTNFPIVSVFSTSGGVRTSTIPSDIVTDDSAGTTAVTIYNSSSSVTQFDVYWKFLTLSTANLSVTDTGNVRESYEDTSPQLTLWGIAHSGAYEVTGSQEGHVTHLDTYKTNSESRVLCGLGGNLFRAMGRTETYSGSTTFGTQYLIPSSQIDIENVILSDATLAPVFDEDGGSVSRTRGTVTSTDYNSSGALVSSVAYVSSGVAIYTLSLAGQSGNLETAISVTSGLEDYLTVTGMANSVNNGTFRITSRSNSGKTITVANSNMTLDTIFNETGARGRCQIYTDQITLTASSIYLPGDTMEAEDFNGVTSTVVGSSGSTLVVGGITSELSLYAGSSLYGGRTSDVIPVRDITNFVKGDMCTVGGYTRKFRVLTVNPNTSDLSISNISVSGTAATATTSSAHSFQVGDKVLHLRTGVAAHDGSHTILTVPSTTTYTYAVASGTATSSTGIVHANTIALDESAEFIDGPSPSTFSVEGRWIPVEAPTTSDTLVDDTTIYHFDSGGYNTQGVMRSTMVADNLYLTNGADEVYKFDGTNLSQAGLFRWQPQLFSQLDTTTASITLQGPIANVAAVSDTEFTVGNGEEVQFIAGDILVHSADSATYTVTSTSNDGTAGGTGKGFVYVSSAISGAATGTLRKPNRYTYYFRLHALDANNNILASAATGSSDFQFDLTAAGQIKIRMLGMPAWGHYDYDKLELEVYRTKSDSAAPFYRVGVKDVNFNVGGGYIDLVDSTTDDLLGSYLWDPVNTSLKGAELGTGWTHPLRARYVTSMNNRLVLGNVRDYPQLDISLVSDESGSTVTAANLTGKRILFRRDDSSTDTATDMVNEVGYEFLNSGATTITPNADISKTSTTFTVADAAHTLSAGDWVYMFHSTTGTVNSLTYAGWWQVNSVSAGVSFTVKADMDTAATANDVDRYIVASASTDVPVWIGADGNYNHNIYSSTFNEFTMMHKLANAVNASMRMCDTTVTAMASFTPWMVANSGSEIGLGRLLVRQEKVLSTDMEVVLPAAVTGASWYVHGVKRAAGAEVGRRVDIFSSRVIVSYPHYPDLFDNPMGDSSDSIIDINPADGEQVTGIIPFFGSSVFGGGTYEDLLVVFKTNSIYLVNVASRQVSKLQSRGMGCTAPFSIASTRDGIIFANNSGIYRLNRDQTLTYIGKYMERFWQDSVNRDSLSNVTGHHYAIGRRYKISVPIGSSSNNTDLYEYDHQREGVEGSQGAWTRSDGYNATGWCNLGNDEFHSTTDGQVFRTRSAGDSTDYRDDASAITSTMVLRAEDFGNPGVRKIVSNIITHFQMRNSSMTGTTAYSSVDLSGDFSTIGEIDISSSGDIKVGSRRLALPTRRCTSLQIKFVNGTIDEDVILSGVDYNVAILNSKGITEIGS